MKVDLFRMERTQCLYENEVEFNLSESGVSLSIAELLPEPSERAALEAEPLRYPNSTGRERPRANVAAIPGSDVHDRRNVHGALTVPPPRARIRR